jgi:hypothetical protein
MCPAFPPSTASGLGFSIPQDYIDISITFNEAPVRARRVLKPDSSK